MNSRQMQDLRYPVGVFEFGVPIRPEDRPALLVQIGEAPERLRAAVSGLLSVQLDTPYRPGGWTVGQVTHHLADAHLNWYVRTELAVTQAEPTIKPYDEARWAELQDARSGPLELSLALFDSLHQLCLQFFQSLSPADWSRKFYHPERGVLAGKTRSPRLPGTAGITQLLSRN